MRSDAEARIKIISNFFPTYILTMRRLVLYLNIFGYFYYLDILFGSVIVLNA